MPKRVLITATVQSHICQFHRPLVKMLHDHGYEVHAAARNNLAEKNGLKLDFVDKVYDVPFSRSPASKDNIKAFRVLKQILDQENYDVIHCNTPMGGIVTRLAAVKARKHGTRVIYTAHGFHFYKGAPLKNWLIYYPIEYVMAFFTDTLITITKEDYRLAKRHFHTDVKHMHGVGANEDKYLSVSGHDAAALRQELGCQDRYVILCTGELNDNKNQKSLISAMPAILARHPEAYLLLAGNGPTEKALKEQVRQLGLSDHVQLIGYHTDLERYTNMCDMVVSVSFREGMPLNIMEGMICGKPIAASYNRGHRELVKNQVNGLLVKADGISQIADRISYLIEHPAQSRQMGEKGRQMVRPYCSRHVAKELDRIYFS